MHWGKTGLTLASSSAVCVFSTTAVATGISAPESCILKNKLMEGAPRRIQLTDNLKKHYLNFLVRKPRGP